MKHSRLKILLFVTFAISAILFAGCSPKQKKDQDIVVFCCAGLSEVMTLLADSFETQSNTKVRLNFASSGTLARQLKNGAPADVYLSASPDWMHYCIQNAVIDSNKVRPYLKNSLVWIQAHEAGSEINFLARNIKPGLKIALGDPAHVPAGNYAQQYLTKLGFWEKYKNQLVPCRDVKNTLFMVERAEADYGMVYYTDAIRSHKVDILKHINDRLHAPILISIASVGTNPEANKFINYLQSEKFKSLYTHYGFITNY